jgi:hypothetical protein
MFGGDLYCGEVIGDWSKKWGTVLGLEMGFGVDFIRVLLLVDFLHIYYFDAYYYVWVTIIINLFSIYFKCIYSIVLYFQLMQTFDW